MISVFTALIALFLPAAAASIIVSEKEKRTFDILVSILVLAMLLVTAVRLSPELAAMEERSVLLARVQAAMGWTVDAREDEAQETDAPAATDEAGAANEESSGR